MDEKKREGDATVHINVISTTKIIVELIGLRAVRMPERHNDHIKAAFSRL